MGAFGVLMLLGAIGCGLMAGFFFAFSVCVMKALGKLPAEQGIAAMQSINVVVINPLFLGVFLGMGAVCALTAVLAVVRWDAASAVCALAASVLYLFGTLFVTMAFNVPRNNALAPLVPSSVEATKPWAAYLTEWTVWNHVRTLAALAAAMLFTVALTLVH